MSAILSERIFIDSHPSEWMVHWSGWTKHLSVGSSGQLTQHVLHWMSELHCSRHFFSTSAHVRGRA